MALEAGSVFVRLVGLFDSKEFDKWDKAVDSERAKSEKGIQIKLAADATSLDKDLTEARSKVSRWARTQDKFTLSYARGALDKELSDAKGRIAIWGDKSTPFKLNYGKGSLDATLKEARANIAVWGEFENKFKLSFDKGFLSEQLIEARAMIRAGLENVGKVKVDVDTSTAMAKIAALNAAAGGAGGVGGAAGGGASGGGGGGGGGGAAAAAAAGAAAGGGGFQRVLQNAIFRPGGPRIPGTRYRIPLGGFSAATILGLGPEHLVGAAGSLVGSAGGAAAGGAALGLGALGQLAVGGGADALITGSTIADTKTLATAMDAVTKAEARYGKGSTQATQATAALNDQMNALGNTAGVHAEAGLAKLVHSLNQNFDKASSNARVQSVNILKQVVSVGSTYVPLVTKAAEDNLRIINKNLRPLFTWIKGPEGIQIFQDLERHFKQNLPTSIDALTNGLQLIARLMDIASNYTGGFTKAIDNHLKKWNQLDNAYLNSKVGKVIQDFKLWEQLLKDLGHDLALLFRAGAGEGNDLVAMMDHGLKVFGAWEASAKGQTFLHTFFENRKVELEAIIGLIGSVLKLFGEFYKALQPLVPAVTMFVQSAAQGFGALARAMTPVFQIVADILSAFVKLGQQNTLFKDAVIVPLGAALISFRLFGAAGTKAIFDVGSHLAVLRRALVGMRVATAAIFAGESVGTAWQKLKDVMKVSSPASPAATMEAGIISGSRTGAAIMAEAIVAASGKGAVAMETGVATGGATAAAEERLAVHPIFGTPLSAKEAAAIESTGRGTTHPIFGTPLSQAEGAGAGAAASQAGRFSRFASGAGRLAGRLGGAGLRAIPYIGAGYLAASALGPASQRGNVAARIGGGAAVGAAGGATVGTFVAPVIGTAIGAGIGALGGAAAGALTSLLGIGNDSRAEKNLADLDKFRAKIKAIADPAGLSAKQIRALQAQATNLAKEVPSAVGPLNTLWHRLNSLPAAVNVRRWKSGFNEAWAAVHDFQVRGGDSIKNIKDRFDTNMRLIAHTLGLESKNGQRLANANFTQMVDHITRQMRRGKINVTDAVNAMTNAAKNGTDDMRNYLSSRYGDIVSDIEKSWKKGKTSTQDALSDIRKIYKAENNHIRTDIQTHYQQLLDDAKKSYDDGELTTAQYTAKRTSIHRQMAHDIAAAEVKLSTSSGRILDGLNTATAAGMDQLFKELNKALDALNVKQVKWGVSKVGNVVSKSLGNISGAIPFINNAGTGGGGIGHRLAGGGILPGAEFGRGDHMTLVDPMGNPRAKMAGDELIFTRHQAPYVEAGLQMLGFGGATDLWNTVDRPHGYEKGGPLQFYARGGKSAFPNFPANFDGRPSNVVPAVSEIIGLMEHRFPNLIVTATRNGGHANGSLHYIGEAVDMAADPATMINAANYVMMSGLYKYLLEGIHNPNLSIKNGRRVSPGFWGASTWAGHANHLHLASSNIGGGLGATGGGAQGGFGVFNNIKAPTISGPGGALQQLAQGAVRKATRAANAYGQNQAGQFNFAGISGGGSNAQNEALGLRMMLAAGWGAGQWPYLKALWIQESGWNANAVNPSSGAYGIPQSLGHGHPYNLGDAKAQIAWGLNYIKQRYGSPAAAEAHERSHNWYKRGGALPGFRTGGSLAKIRTARTARKPPAPKGPKSIHKRHTSKSTSLAKYVDDVQGVKQFSADDAAIARLETLYGRQEQIYQQYDTDPATGNLPVNDLNVLVGLRIKEWDILNKEYKTLPGILAHLKSSLLGKPHGHPGTHFTASGPHVQFGEHRTGGINRDVAHLENEIGQSEKEIVGLRKELASDLNKERTARHHYSAQALKIADSTAAELTRNANAIDNNLEAANRISDQIANIPSPQRATPTAGLHGSSYAQAQGHNQQISRSNAALARERHDLSGKRRRVLDGNVPLHKEHDKIMAKKRAQSSRLRHEGFDAAWAYSLQRYHIDTKIFDIQQKIKLLKQKLKREKALQKAYQGAEEAINTRLHGGNANDPSATSIVDQMGDIGFDILSLAQEGAKVPLALTGDIIKILQKLGVKIPSGLTGGAGAGTTSQAAAFDDFLAFQASRANLFASFGSNFVSAGQNPYGSAAQIAAGSQFYGAAAGVAGGGSPPGAYIGPAGAPPPVPPGGGDTNINITQNFAAGPSDAHSYTAGLKHEMSALM